MQADFVTAMTVTDANGKYRFDGLTSAEYLVTAQKEAVGRAEKRAAVPAEHGIHVDLLIRPELSPKMFVKVPLDNGFAIRGNANYHGALRAVRVRMAYAAWGGSKSFTNADFSLSDVSMIISFGGVREISRDEMIQSPNVLKFTPVTNAFYVEVKGFDPNRALYADARARDDDEGTDEAI
jgi:hypothetical protein